LSESNGQPYRSIHPDELRIWLGDYLQRQATRGGAGLPTSIDNAVIDLYLANETPLACSMVLLLALHSVGLDGAALHELLGMCARRQDLRVFAGRLLEPGEVT
jgi:hypothetical protein